MENTIGKTDYNIIKNLDEKVLYYLFPMIERIVIEILKFKPDSNFEFYNQGVYRTLNSVIECEKNKKYLSEDILSVLDNFYRSDGLRNKIMHFNANGEFEIMKIEIKSVKELFLKVLKEYNTTLRLNKKNCKDKIELLK